VFARLVKLAQALCSSGDVVEGLEPVLDGSNLVGRRRAQGEGEGQRFLVKDCFDPSATFEVLPSSPPRAVPSMTWVKPWVHHLYAMGGGISCLDLSGEDIPPHHPDVFYVSGLGPYTTVKFVQEKFVEAGFGKVSVMFTISR
jgi:hypothetical protein